jgi:hypothetical protein
MIDDWRMPPPKTKYRMFWRGEWRPVMRMYDANNSSTTVVIRVSKAILYMAHDTGVLVLAGPGEVMENADYRTSEWETSY